MALKKIEILSEEEKFNKRLSMTYTERFYLLMRQIKLNKKLSKAKIIYPAI